MPEVTIIIPSYKTPALSRLCLRSLRLHTDLSRIRIIVIDNDSGDESVEYLRSLSWITFLERKTGSESGFEMHARALDEALKEVSTPLVMIMHTDTVMIADGWLDYLLSRINASEKIAGVGSWKLETSSRWKCAGQRVETFFRKLLGRKVQHRERYFRSHCALYKTELVRQYTNGFFDGESAGESMFRMLKARGYELPFIPEAELSHYLRHLNHATMILNPQPTDRKTATPEARAKLRRELDELHAEAIIADASLDRL